MDLLSFDPSEHLQKQAATVVPPGWYVAKVISATKVNARLHTKDSPRRYLELEWSILEVFQNENKDSANKYGGKRVWDRLNLINPVEQTVSIAEKTLSYAMGAMGLERLVDGRHTLVGIPCLIRLVVQPETADYDAKNNVKGFKSLPANNKFIEEATRQRMFNCDPVNRHAPDEDEASLHDGGGNGNGNGKALAAWEKELRGSDSGPIQNAALDNIPNF